MTKEGIIEELRNVQEQIPEDVVDILHEEAVKAHINDGRVYMSPAMAIAIADEITLLRENFSTP